MTDFVALQAHIEGEPVLLTLLEAGSNGELATALDVADTGVTPVVVSRQAVLAAIGDGLRNLPDPALQRLRILLGGEQIDFRDPATEAELREPFSAKPDVLDRLTAIATRPKRLADRFDTVRVSLNDVREIARRVSSSKLNRYLRGEA